MTRIVIATSLTAALLFGGATPGFAQQPDPACGRWSEAPSADPATWPKLAGCGGVGGQALAKVLRAEAVRADTSRLSGLEQALRRIQDSSVFRGALELARDSTAAAAARIVAISIALGQFDRMIVRRPSSGFTPILADSVASRCHLDLDHQPPKLNSATRLPAVAAWLLASAVDQVASGRAPGAVRLFARCARLAIPDGLVQRPAALLGTVRDTTGRPIADADVVGVAGVVRTRTNTSGTFLLGDLAPGPEFVLVRAIGFTPQRFPITLAAGDTTAFNIVLGPAPQQLAELTVTAYGKSYTGKLASFGRRMLTTAAPRSSFIGPEEVERWGAFSLANVIRRAGLVLKLGHAGSLDSPPEGLSCPGENFFGRPHEIAVYLDGVLFFQGLTWDINAFPVQWVSAVEIYRRITEAPIEFQPMSALCAVLITTK